ncbi:MAG: DNA-binding response regulator [Planctomycetaceae bacterium]|nr:DNA-binding response regulator [Planctomycetaceae bacterium]
MTSKQTVFIVDDDGGPRDSVAAVVESLGIASRQFCSAEAFLDVCCCDAAGCLVTDLRMPGMSGLDLQEWLAAHEFRLPVVLITAYADVPLAVRAMKSGAVTVLEKPCSSRTLGRAILDALKQDTENRRQRTRQGEVRSQLAHFSEDDRQLIDLVVAGIPNKAIAQKLNMGLRTVERRRRHIFQSLQIETAAQLARLASEAERSDG